MVLLGTHSQLEAMNRHWDGIVKWYESKINNGILEGLNSVIQAAKSKAREYKTFKNYKIIIYLLTGKLNFNLVNSKFRWLLTHTFLEGTSIVLYPNIDKWRNSIGRSCPCGLQSLPQILHGIISLMISTIIIS